MQGQATDRCGRSFRSGDRSRWLRRSAAIIAINVLTTWSAVGVSQQTPAPTPQAPPARDIVAGMRENSRNFEAELVPTRDTARSFAKYGVMLNYGKCAASIDRKAVLDALSTRPVSPEERKLWLLTERLRACGPEVSRITSLVRGSLAEGVVRKAQYTLAPTPQDSPRYRAFVKGENAYNALREVPDQSMATATDCLVASDPAAAMMLLETRHGSSDEDRRMDTLFAAHPQCAGSRRPREISRSFIRAFLAEAIVRYARFFESAS